MHLIGEYERYIWVAVIAAIGIGLLLTAVIYPLIKRKKYEDSYENSDMSEDYSEVEDTPEFKAVGAVVLDKKAEMFSLGKSHSLKFTVYFLTDDGETVEMDVSQEVYGRLNKSQVGNLVTVNGNFFDFGDGEEIE
ncbi:MAG: DUF2500 family protein [Clostridia bacterium]|nr:DUF2500 family protein [Clostridia bacterium]